MSDVELPIDSASELMNLHLANLHPRYETTLHELALTDILSTAADWQALQQKFVGESRKSLAQLLQSGKSNPLAWGLPEQHSESDTADLLVRLSKAAVGKNKSLDWAAEALPNWLAEVDGRVETLDFAIECLAWAQASRELAVAVEPHDWLELMTFLISLCDDSIGLDREHTPLLHQLLAGELAVTLGYQFPGIERLRQRATSGRKALAVGILELLDGEGLPAAEHLSLLRPLIACWSRTAAMTRQLREPLLIDEAREGFAWAVQQMFRLCRPDGRQMLDGESHRLSKPFVSAALEKAADLECRAVAKLGGHLGKKKAKSASQYEAPQAGAESEWAAVGVLRSDWTRRAHSLLAVHPANELRLELNLGKETLLSGCVVPEIEVDGHWLQLTGEWEQICWQADDDVDYLELEIELSAGWKLQRQMLLARDDCFVLISDAVLCPDEDMRSTESEPYEIVYRCRYPLLDDWSYQPAEETSEGTLHNPDGKPRALILPLALPEWRGGASRGRLFADEDNHLVLAQQQRGSRLFAPLFIDLYSRRMRKQVTWRQLTVADQLQIQAAEVAVGYRVQMGLEQWLIYRSLAAPRNRTVMGHNLTTEFLVARFDDGETDELLEIE